MNVAGKKRNIRLLRQDIPIFGGKREKLIFFSEKQQIVTQVNNHFAIVGKRLNSSLSYLLRFLVFACEAEISFGLAQHFGPVFHGFRYAAHPFPSQREVMRLNSSVDASSYNQRILRVNFIALAIGRLSSGEIAARSEKVAECKVSYMRRRIYLLQMLKIFLRLL